MKKLVFLIAVLAGIMSCKTKAPDALPPSLYVTCSPNPFADMLTVFVNNSTTESGTVRVFDAKNKMVFEQSVTASTESWFKVDLSEGPDGACKVVLSTASKNYSQQVIKIGRK